MPRASGTLIVALDFEFKIRKMSIINIKKIGFFPIILLSFLASCTSKPSDKEMQQNINKELSGNENYKNVNASVSNSMVTLSGDCEGENCVTEIEKVVKKDQYVDSVINNVHQKSTGIGVPLNTSLQKIISNYPGVQADISDSILTLKGSITKENLPILMKEVSSLHPKKIDDHMVVKVN